MSLTYIGVITTVIGWLFNSAGVPFVPADLQSTVTFVVALVGVIVTLYGRYRAGGISALGFRL